MKSGTGDGKFDLLRQIYFKKNHGLEKEEAQDKTLVNLILEQAKRVIAHPGKPTVHKLERFPVAPFSEIALEETLEESPMIERAAPEEILVETILEKPFSCVTMLDSSSSMAGEKHLLASIAVAVLLLEIESRNTSLVLFSSRSKVIKKMRSEESKEKTLLKFISSQPRGFTNIADGLEEGLKQCKIQRNQRRKVGLLATDGRTTEGEDPLCIAKQFDFLAVLHLHGPGSSIEASRSIAQAGHGVCLEVERFEELPKKMYEAIRYLARQ